MPVPLNKTITRWVKVGGEDYKLILEPSTETDSETTNPKIRIIEAKDIVISLIKKASRQSEWVASLEEINELLTDRFNTTSSKHDSMVKSLRKAKGDRHYDNIAYKDILSRVGELHVKLADQLREIVDDIYEVNCLASDLSDEELVKRGIDPLN